jgi:hypothetical protein
MTVVSASFTTPSKTAFKLFLASVKETILIEPPHVLFTEQV